MIRWMCAALTLGAFAVPADAQRRDRDRDEESRSRIDTTLTLARGGTVDLSLVSGEIRVTASSGNTVRLRAMSEGGRLELSTSSNRIAVEVKGGRYGRMGEAEYDVAVPAGTRLLLKAVQGDISARDVRGEIEATTVNGDIEISGAASRVIAGTVSGSVVVTGVQGNVRGTAVSGDVTLERVQGEIEAESVSGDIVLDEVVSRSVRTESVSGDVYYEGNVDGAGRYEFRSHSGDVRLVVPSDIGALLTVKTFSGEIDSDFPLQLQPSREEHRAPRTLQFTLGRGGARVDIETFSGDVALERRGARSQQGARQ